MTAFTIEGLARYARERKLTFQERERFGELWEACYRELFAFALIRASRNYWATQDLMSDLAAHLLVPRVYRILGDDPSEVSFCKFAKNALRFLIGHRFDRRRIKPTRSAHREFSRMEGAKSVVRGTTRFSSRSPVVDAVLRAERKSVLHKKFGYLSDRQRLIVTCCVIRGESAEAVADRIGISRSLASDEKNRALAKLRMMLPKVLDPGGVPMAERSNRIADLYHKGDRPCDIARRFGFENSASVFQAVWKQKRDADLLTK